MTQRIVKIEWIDQEAKVAKVEWYPLYRTITVDTNVETSNGVWVEAKTITFAVYEQVESDLP